MAQQIIRRNYTTSEYENVAFVCTSTSTLRTNTPTRYRISAGLSNYKIDKIEVYIKLNEVIKNSTKPFVIAWGVDFGLEEKWKYFNVYDTGTFAFTITNPTTIAYFLNSYNATAYLLFETQVVTGWSGTEYVTYKYDLASNNNTYILAYVQTPNITSVNPSTGFIDRTTNNTFSWGATYSDGSAVTQKSAIIEWKEGTSGSVNTVNINNSTKSHEFISGTFPKTTDLMWRVKVVDINDLESEYSTWSTIDSRGDLPTITTLEPSSVNQNLNIPITVSWTSEHQSAYKLTVDGNVYTGTTAKSLVLASNALTAGTKTMMLEVTYIPTWATSTADHRKVTKTVTFLAYGKPLAPIQDSVTSYPGATPTLTWSSSEQVAYRVKIMQGETLISDSNEVISTATSYLSPTALTNLTTYRSLVQVKNQYDLWSDNSEKTFTISYTEMPQPTISSYGDVTNSSIVTNFEIEDAVGFAKNELWRKEQYGEWIRIAYNMSQKDVYVDNYVKANTEYSYKCRAVDIYGGISESEIITASTQVTNFRFYDLENLDNFIELIGEPSVTPTRVKNKAVELYAGCPAPSVETDGVAYNTYAMEFEVSKAEFDKFQDITDKAKVILFRDCRGNKAFGQVISNISPVKSRAIDLYNIKFTFCDMAFLERDVYNGSQHAILLYFDGTWLFDGSQNFTGFRSW